MAVPDAYTLISRLRIHMSIIIQDVLEAYHARSLAHLRQLRAEVPSNIFLYIPREINACPVVDNSTIDHFLHQKENHNVSSMFSRLCTRPLRLILECRLTAKHKESCYDSRQNSNIAN